MEYDADLSGKIEEAYSKETASIEWQEVDLEEGLVTRCSIEFDKMEEADDHGNRIKVKRIENKS